MKFFNIYYIFFEFYGFQKIIYIYYYF